MSLSFGGSLSAVLGLRKAAQVRALSCTRGSYLTASSWTARAPMRHSPCRLDRESTSRVNPVEGQPDREGEASICRHIKRLQALLCFQGALGAQTRSSGGWFSRSSACCRAYRPWRCLLFCPCLNVPIYGSFDHNPKHDLPAGRQYRPSIVPFVGSISFSSTCQSNLLVHHPLSLVFHEERARGILVYHHSSLPFVRLPRWIK